MALAQLRDNAPQSMVWIAARTFGMGSTDGDRDEQPVHQVYVDGLYMDQHEVTVHRYRGFAEATGGTVSDQPQESKEEHPVVEVTWQGACPPKVGGQAPTHRSGTGVCRTWRPGRKALPTGTLRQP